jgi:hypothetical protein
MILPIVATLCAAGPAAAQFTGDLVFEPAGCEEKGLCKLTYKLLFKDPQGLEWQADAQDKTDGASIPPWAQPLVGKPFDPAFIKAAAIHDHYCERHVRSWRATHRVFYDALIATGVPTAKAKIMYYAVYLGGPKWVKLIAGKSCGSGIACINRVEIDGKTNPVGAGSSNFLTRAAQYDEPGFAEELAAVAKLLDENNSDISLTDLESRAKKRRPGDFYYQHGDDISLGTQLQIK